MTLGLERDRGVLVANHVIDGDGERLFVQEAFPTGPGEAFDPDGTVVFCHGAGGCHLNWFQQVPVFARRYRVLTWDQRGFGKSTNFQGRASPEAAIEDLSRILDAFEVPRAHLVGQSLGGWVALGTALRDPARTASVVLSDSVGGLLNAEIENALDDFIDNARTQPAIRPIGQSAAIEEQFGRSRPALAFLYQQISGLGTCSLTDAVTMIRNTRVDPQEATKVAVPLLAVVGEHDRIFTPEAIRDVTRHLPNMRVAVIPGAGHSAYFERPDEFNTLLNEFLTSTD